MTILQKQLNNIGNCNLIRNGSKSDVFKKLKKNDKVKENIKMYKDVCDLFPKNRTVLN